MRRTQTIVASGFFSALLLSVATAPAPSLAGGNCMTKLISSGPTPSGFDCNVKFSDGSSELLECWTFAKGSLSHFFDIFTETIVNPMDLPEYGCACDTTGSFKSPRFNSSADQFECDDGLGDQLEGKIKGKKISGQGSDSQGNAVIFSCVPNGGCG